MFSLKNDSIRHGVSQSRLSMRRRSIILFSIIVCALVSFFCFFILNAETKNVQSFYRESSEYNVHYRAKFLSDRLSGYLADLNRIAASKLVQGGDSKKINKSLARLKEIDMPYVLDLCYADLEGMAYTKAEEQVDIKKTYESD